MTSDALHSHVVQEFSDFVNPYLGKLMNFAGFGVEASAQGCIITDHEGREYIDCLGGYGVFSLGHRHPKVVEAVIQQLSKMPLGSKVFFSQPCGELAHILADCTPGDLQYTFFSNSGAEAVEAALKFAKAATGRPGLVSTVGSYHGKTLGALAVTGREKYQKRFQPLMPGAVHVPFGDADAAIAQINDQTACFIIETVQGEGGIHVAPDGYLAKVQARCREVGALFIVDEVQTGLGRTGKLFGSEWHGVQPDIMTLAKCLGGGVMPIGATISTPDVFHRVYGDNPLVHTSTFGGNPLACSAGIAAMKVIQEEGLVERSLSVGAHMKGLLESVQAKHSDLISDVRGQGLMLGVEFAMDEVGELVIAQMTKRGVIAAYTLNNPRVIRLEPPLIIRESQVEQAVEALDQAVQETGELLASLV